ncbi:MAG: serine/threonine protein kinase [Myxococcaceae bacterium]|nr:MAG: serine/threonine protein kinase [Myxococcaceae bacterium]
MSDDGSLFEARDPFLGKVVAGKYVIDGFLGAGAMGRVYRATQRPLDKLVAVKVLHANFGADQVTLQRFLREAKAASRFDHPNSVTVFDFGIEPDGTAYIVMEYLRGESLEDLIQREGTLAAPRCVAIMSQVLAALSEAHDAGIVHRDLKPENIMLVSRGGEDFAGETVKVADFGIAKMLGDDDPRAAAKITATGIISGSPAYMSPEQAQALPVDGRSDLYQCGVILYEMITGEIPFFANNAIGVIMQHISQPAPSARLRNPACPEVLDALIAKAMAKDPERRFSNARAMRQALKLVAPDQVTPTANLGLQSTPKPLAAPRPAAASNVTETQPEASAAETPAPKPPPPAPRRRFVQVAAMVSGAVALAAVVVAISPRADRSAPLARPARTLLVAPVVDAGAPVRVEVVSPARSEDAGASEAVAVAAAIAEASPPEREAGAQARARTRGGSRSVAPVVAEPEPVRPPAPTPAVIEPTPATSVVAPVVVAPVVAAAAAPPPAVAPPPPAPTLRGVRGSLGSMQVSGGLTRGAIQGRANQAADALARCVQRAAESRGGAAAFGSPTTVSAVVAVRDRRADEARLSGGGALVGGCRDAVLGAFRGDLPQAEDTEYEVRLTISLEPQF